MLGGGRPSPPPSPRGRGSQRESPLLPCLRSSRSLPTSPGNCSHNDLKHPAPVPRDTDYSSVFTSDVPIVMQHTRLDSRQAENALLSTMAFPVPSWWPSADRAPSGWTAPARVAPRRDAPHGSPEETVPGAPRGTPTAAPTCGNPKERPWPR
ncbi:sensory rhodopsin transducer [Archangium lansingense]|uniref:sensory rhodopsin transducer n=1 Tax=Archangium lansingense TaxID=2995310 RepID=UPI003B8261D0